MHVCIMYIHTDVCLFIIDRQFCKQAEAPHPAVTFQCALKRRQLLDTATADVANILVELSQNPTENSTPACSASIAPAPIPCTVKLPSPVTLCHKHTQTTKGHDTDIVAVKIKNVILNHENAKLRQQLAECQETNGGIPLGHFGIHDVKDNEV